MKTLTSVVFIWILILPLLALAGGSTATVTGQAVVTIIAPGGVSSVPSSSSSASVTGPDFGLLEKPESPSGTYVYRLRNDGSLQSLRGKVLGRVGRTTGRLRLSGANGEPFTAEVTRVDCHHGGLEFKLDHTLFHGVMRPGMEVQLTGVLIVAGRLPAGVHRCSYAVSVNY